jgi:hypothetical protein
MAARGRRAIVPRVPKIILLALGAATVTVLCILAIIGTDDVVIALLTVLAIAFIGLAIVAETRGVISAPADDAPAAPPPGRAVVMCTGPMTAEQVLGALGETDHRSIMFVAPEGLGGRGLMVDERDYARALQAETATVAALRRAGLNAAGHVGDRNPAHAIVDALALFPASQVVIVARGEEGEIYRRHVDSDELKRRTGADVRVLEGVGT